MVAEPWCLRMGNQVSTNVKKNALLVENSRKLSIKKQLGQSQVIGILSFEVANMMSKIIHLHKSLQDSEILKLKNEIFKCIGINNLVSDDEDKLLELVLVEKLDDLNRVASVVSRLGKKCTIPALQGFEHVYGDIVSGVIDVRDLGFLVKDMEGRVRKMERYVNSTASLYSEMAVLNELELATKKFQQNQHEESRKAYEQKLAWQKQDVRHLEDVSLWNQSYDKVVELLARTVCTVYARISTVFGNGLVKRGLARNSVAGSQFGCSGSLQQQPKSGVIVADSKREVVDADFKKPVLRNRNVNCHSGPIDEGLFEKSNSSHNAQPKLGRNESSLFGTENFNFACGMGPGRLFMECLSLSSASKLDVEDDLGTDDRSSQMSGCCSVSSGMKREQSNISGSFNRSPSSVRLTEDARQLNCMSDAAKHGPKSRIMLYAPATTVGGSALALHYANVIIVIEKLLQYPHLVGDEGRDDLYQMLPTSLRKTLKASLRSYMKGLAIYDGPLAHDWKERLEGILKWLAPLAHNMIRWQSERNFEQQQIVKRTNVLLLQTLYFADCQKMEAVICELLVGLNYICRFEQQQNALLDCASSIDFEDCMEWQQEVSQVNQLELRTFLQEPQGRHVAACYGSTSATVMEYFDTWEATASTTSNMYGDNNKMYNNFAADEVDKWNNVSFGDLLKLAHAAGSTATTENPIAETPFTMNGSFNSHISSQDAGGSSVCSRFPFNLNSPARMTEEVLSSNNAVQLEPVTPDQIKNKRQASNGSNLDINETPIPRHMQSSEDALKRAEANDSQQSKETSRLVLNISELQEDHKPDMADEQDAEQNNTPQQKRRRKKHRPKVVLEGQPKRTPKPRTPQQNSSKETNTGKRKYVRRNKGGEALGTPSDKVNNMISHEGQLPSSSEIPGAQYDRRNQVYTPTPSLAKEGTIDPPKVSRPRRSCRRSLNFDSESRSSDENSSHWPSSTVENLPENQSHCTVHLGKGIGATTEKTEWATAYDITCSVNQELKKYLARHEMQYPDPSTLKKIGLHHDKFTMDNQNEISRGKCKIIFSDETHDKQASILEMTPKSPNSSYCSSSACLIQETPERSLKRRHPFRTDEAEHYSTNVRGAYFNSMQAYQAFLPANEPYMHSTQGMHFPAIYKKKRTEKGHPSAISCPKPFTCESNYLSLSQCHVGVSQASTSADGEASNRMQNPKLLPAFVEADKLRRKRSKSLSKVRDLASLLEISKHFPTHVKEATISGFGEKFENSDQPNTCMDALVADTRAIMKTKKRSKRSILVSSTASPMYARQQFTTNARGSLPAITWRIMSPVDEIVERLRHLDLNRETIQDQDQYAEITYQNKFQAENALVIYQRDGSIVPFTGSFIRRRRPRPKVDLDDETTRVWKLLLQDINSEGIDGTDEDKAKWWEGERGVFHGRVDSFVSRMRLVQGDRRFSPWKGSVVDSVVGVFLTQNVSDHLSSSAFMSLAAQFPLKSTGIEKHEERTGIIIEEPEVSAQDPDDTIGWHDDLSSQPTLGQDILRISSTESDDEKTAVHSSESSENSLNCTSSTENSISQQPGSSRGSSCVYHESTVYGSAMDNAATSSLGDQADVDDLLSSQNSVLSSENSVNFSVVQTSEKTESSRFCGSTSFLRLLQMAGTSKLHGVQDQKSEIVQPNTDVQGQLKHGASCSHFQKDEENHRDSLENVCPCGYSDSCPVPSSGAHRTKCNEDLEEAAKYADLSRKLSVPEQSKISAESADQALDGEMRSETYIPGDIHQNKVDTATMYDAEVNFQLQIQTEESNYNMQQVAEAPISSEVIVDVREEVSVVVESCKSEDTVRSNSNNEKIHAGTTLDRTNDNPKGKRERPGKEKQNVDWDNLRLEAQKNGKKRERTANTMDSVDWDAVRCADVNEIAHTIRERGMNNMLAERIKDFLNRIFREHGSIDLEWLRDVPPDKAKEYLLSIRGLGLKSVECVRLLTLHHLAFPVDTNVGRIAVRLGWVPLQPLPESLQLHLLELYPVLESIQKYLWPRLCKLDQRTLYELHYHMITFGKVFCTKSKPNCNACPLRGECRHFASAFASARLALPAPEEKSIVSATENKAAGQNPFQNSTQLPLSLPQENQMPIEHPKLINSAPIIEVPATPEPIVEEPATPEPEIKAPEIDIEDAYFEDPNEIPTIELNMAQFTQNVKNFVENHMELQPVEMSKALVALTPETASIPTPKLKHISRLRTEHQVYELPDSHPLLEGFDKREPDDPCFYLLAIWTPGETVDSIQPPGRQCNSQETGRLCDDETCFACNSIREAHSQTVRGTLLIPCRTAMRGSFPLNGTYFQVNEVFADHDSSLKPIDVPRDWLWNLPRRTVYFGTSIPTIFKGQTTESIQHCFWRGFVCVRGFDKKTRSPRPLIARLHFPASKLTRTRGQPDEN